MKVRNSIRSLKNQPGAQVVRRRGRTYVINQRGNELRPVVKLRSVNLRTSAHRGELLGITKSS